MRQVVLRATPRAQYLCRLGLDDPEGSVDAVHAGSVLGIVIADSQHTYALAIQCGHCTACTRARRGNAPGQHLTTHPGGRLRPVDFGVLGFEETGIACLRVWL